MIGKANKPFTSSACVCLLLVAFLVFFFSNLSWSSGESINKAYSYFLAGNMDEAVDELKQIIAEDPKDGLAHLILAFCYLKLEGEKEAYDHLDRAFTYGENDPRFYNFLGKYYEVAGEYEKAISSFAKTIELSPNYAEAYYNYARLSVERTNEYGKAKKALKNCLRLNPSKETMIKAYMLLARTSETESEHKNYLKKVLALDPNNPGAKTLLKFLKMGQEYERNIAISSIAEGHFIKAEKLFRDTKFEQAIEEYKKVIEIEPAFAKPYLYLGYCYYRIEQYEKAMPYFKKSTELDPENPQTWAFLGDVCIHLKDYEAGYENYKKAVDLDPEYHNAVAKLNRIKNMLDAEPQ